MTRISVLLAASLLALGTGWAQTAPVADLPRAPDRASADQTEVQGQSGEGACPATDSLAENATPPQPGADSTDANNAGSSGWSGGLGGSHLGTNAQGALTTSPTWQPPTARGLDLKGRAEPVALQTGPNC
ncbi:hypothetical protein GIY56_05370 [Paracoccus sp. YIM 132242]|uniref:Uncharacterized protein n=1 Tax=Paracoccus lichenicola TaxID=2665644 RepID=A0A6L6HN77_9RHOB|nr:hypothetical protein [Paracoccus lichenicola]MTD99709.1 hypothetical protein [Paracoccus lichenicola]